MSAAVKAASSTAMRGMSRQPSLSSDRMGYEVASEVDDDDDDEERMAMMMATTMNVDDSRCHGRRKVQGFAAWPQHDAVPHGTSMRMMVGIGAGELEEDSSRGRGSSGSSGGSGSSTSTASTASTTGATGVVTLEYYTSCRRSA